VGKGSSFFVLETNCPAEVRSRVVGGVGPPCDNPLLTYTQS